MNDINFKGGFLIKTPAPELWKEIQAELPRRKCVFQNFNEQGDKFFAIKSVYDKAMANILLRKKVKFSLYPEINLKTRLDSENLEEAHFIINAQKNIIEAEDELEQFAKPEKGKKIVLIEKYRWTPDDHIDKTFKAIGIEQSEYKTIIENGITYIKDKEGKKIIAKASPNNEKGINFVYVYPKNWDDSSRRFALTQSGDTYDFGPFEIIRFQKEFMKNVKRDLGRKRPQEQV